jgi:hypothetical protein
VSAPGNAQWGLAEWGSAEWAGPPAATVTASGTGALSLVGSGTAHVQIHATGIGALSLVGSGTGHLAVPGVGVGTLTLTGTGTADYRAFGVGLLVLAGLGTPSNVSPLPNFQVLIDVSGHTPLTVPSVWTDFANYARKISTRRGRQHVLDHYQPGTLTVTFNGRDRVLDAENSAGPYFGLLDINRPMQVNVQYHGAWVPIFTGYIDSITPQWPNNVNEDIVYTASDALRLLNTDTFTELSYTWRVLRDGAQDLYAFGEFDIGTTAPHDAGPGGF